MSSLGLNATYYGLILLALVFVLNPQPLPFQAISAAAMSYFARLSHA